MYVRSSSEQEVVRLLQNETCISDTIHRSGDDAMALRKSLAAPTSPPKCTATYLYSEGFPNTEVAMKIPCG